MLYSQINNGSAQTPVTDVPMIGAEVFIEPGQTPKDIDTWFKRMKEAGMTLTRIRMFERYMHTADGKWDYGLFDEAYKAGEKYEVVVGQTKLRTVKKTFIQNEWFSGFPSANKKD